MSKSAEEIIIVYDGHCPFCSNYVRLVKLRESVGNVILMNARDDIGDIATEIRQERIQLDEGMAVKYHLHWYHGALAMQLLGELSTNKSFFSQLNRLIFSCPAVSKVLYPILRFFRNITLKVLGRKKIDNLSSQDINQNS